MPVCITHANCITYFSYVWCYNSLFDLQFSNPCPHDVVFVNFVAIDASLHHTCKLQDICFIFLMFQLPFRLTAFEAHIAQICIANTTCKIYRMHVLMMSSSCKSLACPHDAPGGMCEAAESAALQFMLGMQLQVGERKHAKRTRRLQEDDIMRTCMRYILQAMSAVRSTF